MRPNLDPILAFDCSAAHCAAAVVSDDQVLAQSRADMPRGSDHLLIPLLERVLAAAALGWRELGALAVCTGPGNFTGIRIGIAAARGLALALSVPAIGVGRLEALAEGTRRPVLASAAARRDSLHLQLFGAKRWDRPRHLDAAEIADLALPAGTVLLGPVAARLPGYARGSEDDAADPRSLAAIARRRGPGARPAPIYPRPPNADLPTEPPPLLLP
ncbi:MAG: tRNA (adenosine(37)-N6)-threonylcarbamoyltransferase complex dimerization subunit type 1 TsaB [Pseudomonadota bacterium]